MAFYTEPQRQMQDRFESRPLADVVEERIVGTELTEPQSGFVASRDFFFLSTVNAEGEPTVSYKGGDVGTVTVVDSTMVAFPAYDGNGMFLSMGNVDDTSKIGLLFIDFETPNRLRVQATATFSTDDELMSEYPGALGVVRAKIDTVFMNCARYIHKHRRVEQSPYIPDENGEQPYPTWKRIDGLQEHLQPSDQGRAEANGGTITQDEYKSKLQRGES